jgi:hypothetical protein
MGGKVILNVCLTGGYYGGVLRLEGGERERQAGEEDESGARRKETGFSRGDTKAERLGSHIED